VPDRYAMTTPSSLPISMGQNGRTGIHGVGPRDERQADGLEVMTRASERCSSRLSKPGWMLLVLASALCIPYSPKAAAERIENGTAVFAALDKVTARISKLDVGLDKTIRFGSLRITPRVCYSRPATETPKTTAFVEVDEIQLDGQERRLFTGWMFAESPGLNAVEHPVFDVWLTNCGDPLKTVAGKGPRPGAGPSQTLPAEPPLEPRRR